MMNYVRYPEYKDSGVAWLGEVPAHWETRRLKYAAPLRNIKIVAGESHLPYIGLENIESWSGKYVVQDEANDSEGLSSRFGPGDVLFGKLRPYLAKAFLANFEGACSSELLVLQGKGVQPEFLVRFVLSVGFIREVDSTTYGAKMPRASWDFIGNLPVTLPPTAEQSAIAAFLDEKTTQIDQLIEKKTRFIELLKEKRAALITEAVTGKFDARPPGKGEVPESAGSGFGVRTGKPYAEYKDSGVGWLGEVPAHWKTRRLKYAAPLRNIKIVAGESHLPYIGLENIESWSGKYVVQDEANDSEGLSSSFYPGDVLFGKLRPYLAKAFLADFEGMCSSELLVLQGKGVQPEFLVRFVLSVGFIREVDSSTYGAKMPRASWDFIGNLPVTLPPTAEQSTITAFLDKKTTQIDQLIKTTQQSINLLKEKRAALITAAVTGKIDVRDYKQTR
ncbi:restriction endonuclease subunit S [Thiolapillus sp.]|uniref:restriction endonuclease subunit S n=1 Tax=Thiolapillus sp. TaxID=2017437 RepID=UPI0025E98947|nr:restriction endonuclease subunit S [Thiolapillus sp.]